MSQYPSNLPPYQSVYPGGPAQHDWQRLYGYQVSRPGILTAIGVLSIVMASISFLGSGFYALAGFVMFETAKMTTTLSTSSSSAYNAPVQGMAATPAAPGGAAHADAQKTNLPEPAGHGMGPTDRATTITALQLLEPMTEDQKHELDAILARAGFDFFPREGVDAPTSTMTAAEVAGAVKAHGTMPNAAADEEDAVYFNTMLGHLELHEKRALFRFSNPTLPAVRTTASSEQAAPNEPPAVIVPTLPAAATPPAASSNDPFAPAVAPAPQADPFANPSPSGTQPAIPLASAGGTGLTPSQISGVILRAQAACSNKLNPAQVNALSAALAKPDQQLVTPGTLWSPISMAQINADGSAVLRMNGGYLEIDPQGAISNQMSMGIPKLRLNPMPIALVVAESLASLALAGFLLFSGIVLLKQQSSRGRRLHQIFALIKIPLAVIAVAGFAWMMADLGNNMRRMPGSSGPSQGFVTFGIVLAASGMIYPIAVLIALQTKAVRDYYSTMAVET